LHLLKNCVEKANTRQHFREVAVIVVRTASNVVVYLDRVVAVGIESNFIPKDSDATPQELFVEVINRLTGWYGKLSSTTLTHLETWELEVKRYSILINFDVKLNSILLKRPRQILSIF